MKVLKYLFALIIVAQSFGQISNLFSAGFVNFYLFDILIFIFVLYSFFIFKLNLFIPKNSFLFLAFIFWATILGFFWTYKYTFNQYLTGVFYLIRFSFYLFSSITIYNLFKKNIINKHQIINYFVLSGVLVSFFGFLQLIIIPDLSILEPLLGWDPHKFRLVSVFIDPNYTGSYLSIIVSILFYKYYYIKNFTKLDLFFLIFILIAIFLTYSRSAWVMLSIIILFYSINNSKILFFSFLILCFMAYFAVPRIQTRLNNITDPADSAYFRLISWNNAYLVFKDYPYFGIGFNNYRFIQTDYGFILQDNYNLRSANSTDSSFLLVLVTTGLVGFFIFVLAYARLILSSNIMVQSVLISLIINSMFINSLFFSPIMFLWIVISVNSYFLSK